MQGFWVVIFLLVCFTNGTYVTVSFLNKVRNSMITAFCDTVSSGATSCFDEAARKICVCPEKYLWFGFTRLGLLIINLMDGYYDFYLGVHVLIVHCVLTRIIIWYLRSWPLSTKWISPLSLIVMTASFLSLLFGTAGVSKGAWSLIPAFLIGSWRRLWQIKGEIA